MDADAAIQQGAYLSLDAADTLSTFMVNGWPDADRFLEGFRNLLPSAAKAGRQKIPGLRYSAKLLPCCWRNVKTEAAIRLEQLGNILAESYNVDVLVPEN
jgi:hypothetical protein